MSFPFGPRRARWRTWLRVHTADVLFHRLGLAVPKVDDCGDPDHSNHGSRVEACYHCKVTRHRSAPAG